MKTRTTFILLVFAAGLYAFIKLYESKMPGTREATDREQYVFSFDREKITGFDLANKEDRIELRKRGGQWRIEKPMTDRADAGMVDQVLGAVQSLKKDASLESTEDGARDFGISKSDVRLKLFGEGAPPEIFLGTDAAVEGKLYLGLNRSKTVYVVDNALRAQLSKKADDFRDRRLSALDATQVEKLTIKTMAGQIEAAKEQGHWEIKKPISARGDDEKIGDLLAQIVNMRIDTFVSEDNSITSGLTDRAALFLSTALPRKNPKSSKSGSQTARTRIRSMPGWKGATRHTCFPKASRPFSAKSPTTCGIVTLCA